MMCPDHTWGSVEHRAPAARASPAGCRAPGPSPGCGPPWPCVWDSPSSLSRPEPGNTHVVIQITNLFGKLRIIKMRDDKTAHCGGHRERWLKNIVMWDVTRKDGFKQDHMLKWMNWKSLNILPSFRFFMGHQVIEFRDNMIESSRTLEYQSSSHSFARNTATEIRCGDKLSHGDSWRK